MLLPEYFFKKSNVIIDIFRELENFILEDIAQRILKTGTIAGTTDRNIWLLEQLGESRTQIMKRLEKYTKLSEKELRKILQDAILTSWEDDLSTFEDMGIDVESPLKNQRYMDVIDAEWKKTKGELHNLTMTTIDQSQKDLMDLMDQAELRIATGTRSYSAEIVDILDNYAKKGIEVNYPTGTTRSLESAVRTCVVTGMNQTTAQLTNKYIVETGMQYVLVSAHYGARIKSKNQPPLADHASWQGKVFKIVGSEPGYPNLEESTGYAIDPVTGVGKVVNPLGLHGYNCRHSHRPWDKNLKNPWEGKIDDEKSKQRYLNEQKMRRMEREIRQLKRELIMKEAEIKTVAETDVKDMLQQSYDRLAYELREKNQRYKDFCKENDFNVNQDRLKTVGFTKEMASRANGRATKYKNQKEGEE